MNKNLFLLFVVFLSVSVIGCSNHVGLSGRVVYSDNGEPVTTGEVQFTTPTFIARALIKPDGTFVAGSYRERDGLPPGTYEVAVVSTDENFNPLVDMKYSNPISSGLSITIDKTTRGIEFVVGRAPPPPAPMPMPPLRR